MTILLTVFCISFLGMSLMLGSKVRAIRAQEVSHHEHVGFGTLMKPLAERLAEFFRVVAAKAYSYLYPVVQFALYRGGLVLHTVSVRIGKKFLDLADTIKGRGVLRRKGDTPVFLRDIIEHQRALRGKLEV